MPRQATDERLRKASERWLARLPDTLLPRLFSMLRETYPTSLTREYIIHNFLKGYSITLTDDLPHVDKRAISQVHRAGTTLRELNLHGFGKIADTVFAALLPTLPHLRVLDLRSCSKVGLKTVEAAARSCPDLTSLNLSYTAATPASLAPILLACQGLEVVKLSGIPNWTDTTFGKLLILLAQADDFSLPHLHTLTLKDNALSESSFEPLLALCPALRRLNLSFTHVRRPPTRRWPPLEKLALTSTRLSGSDVLAALAALPRLRTLALGALGGGPAGAARMGNSSAMTLSDVLLRGLTDTLVNTGAPLENVSLVGNSKLGTGARANSALADFVARVGRRCKKLNLSGITSLRSADLAGLVADGADDGPPLLEVLQLHNTSVDDDAAPFISACSSLRSLDLGGTKFSSAGLFPIIDACPKLAELDLTSCRGVKVSERRRFFEVWETEWKDG